jgi:hypothetical protein
MEAIPAEGDRAGAGFHGGVRGSRDTSPRSIYSECMRIEIENPALFRLKNIFDFLHVIVRH